MNIDSQYLEFEHKYLIDEGEYDLYLKKLKLLKPDRSYRVSVLDWYFLTERQPDYIYRYRRDKELNQLTVKSLQADAESRLEVNLDLSGKQDQLDRVRAFLAPLSLCFEGKVKKQVDVFYFHDCECVVYHASFQDREVLCLEIEVINPGNHPSPRDVLHFYASKLGLNPISRCPKSLFHLLIEPMILSAQP